MSMYKSVFDLHIAFTVTASKQSQPAVEHLFTNVGFALVLFIYIQTSASHRFHEPQPHCMFKTNVVNSRCDDMLMLAFSFKLQLKLLSATACIILKVSHRYKCLGFGSWNVNGPVNVMRTLISKLSWVFESRLPLISQTCASIWYCKSYSQSD